MYKVSWKLPHGLWWIIWHLTSFFLLFQPTCFVFLNTCVGEETITSVFFVVSTYSFKGHKFYPFYLWCTNSKLATQTHTMLHIFQRQDQKMLITLAFLQQQLWQCSDCRVYINVIVQIKIFLITTYTCTCTLNVNGFFKKRKNVMHNHFHILLNTASTFLVISLHNQSQVFSHCLQENRCMNTSKGPASKLKKGFKLKHRYALSYTNT